MFKSFDRFMSCLLTGSIATMLQMVFGELDRTFIVLLIAMGVDMLTGMMVGAFNSELSSKRCFKGLTKKCVILIYVMLAHQLDKMLDTSYIRIGVCYMYIANDILSIIENGCTLGVPVPEPIKKALEIINSDEMEDI